MNKKANANAAVVAAAVIAAAVIAAVAVAVVAVAVAKRRSRRRREEAQAQAQARAQAEAEAEAQAEAQAEAERRRRREERYSECVSVTHRGSPEAHMYCSMYLDRDPEDIKGLRPEDNAPRVRVPPPPPGKAEAVRNCHTSSGHASSYYARRIRRALEDKDGDQGNAIERLPGGRISATVSFPTYGTKTFGGSVESVAEEIIDSIPPPSIRNAWQPPPKETVKACGRAALAEMSGRGWISEEEKDRAIAHLVKRGKIY